ncbi:FAD-dependent oxidoreductase [bacterium]|nr:FAD-dependent oxidoreductase [bacterium]
MRFVIVGGDAAGMSAASRAKRSRPEMAVIVLEKSNDVSYSACGMPYNIADPERAIEDLVVREAGVFREKQKIDLRTGHEVRSLDRDARTVSGTTESGEPFTVAYDKLLIASGASPIVPDLPGFDLPGVMALKSLEDGRRIKAYLEQNAVNHVIVIGMGYIALEMCEALRSRQIDVTMVKPRSVFLPWADGELAGVVKDEVEKNGVKINLGHTIERIVKGPDHQLRVLCSDLQLTGGMVLVAMGVKPNSDFAIRAGLKSDTKNALAVDRRLRTSDDNIYAAGDCADAYHVLTGKKTYIPLALRANRAGWAVADEVCGKEVELPGIMGTSVFKVFDLVVARTGLNMEEAGKNGFDPVSVTIKTRSRAHAHPGSTTIHLSMLADRISGRLLGAQMVGREGVAQRIDAVAVALHAGMTVEQFSQCDLAYAPPFSPVWDPLLTTANQLLKKLG